MSDVKSLRQRLEDRGLTLSAAESCTGGLFSAAITAEPGASKIFLGSVISYHRQVKNEVLGVPRSLLEVMGEVSTPVALEMARGARRVLRSDWAVAITGIAGPGGGSPEKPVGLVCFAVVGPSGELTHFEKFDAKASRDEIQRRAVAQAVDLLYKALD